MLSRKRVVDILLEAQTVTIDGLELRQQTPSYVELPGEALGAHRVRLASPDTPHVAQVALDQLLELGIERFARALRREAKSGEGDEGKQQADGLQRKTFHSLTSLGEERMGGAEFTITKTFGRGRRWTSMWSPGRRR